MFRRVLVSLGAAESLQVFVSQQRDLGDAYITVTDLAASFGLQQEAVCQELSGPLLRLPELSTWLSDNYPFVVDETDSPTKSSNEAVYYFAPSAAWKSFVRSRVTPAIWSNLKATIYRALGMEKTDHQRRSDTCQNNNNKRPRSNDSHDDAQNDDGSDADASNSGSDSSDSSSSSSSDDDSSMFGGTMSLKQLPLGVPSWVLTDPVIPDQFSQDDYTKSYSLKSYDMTRSLQKELKKLRKWWTKERNAERKGAKSVQDATADKREERVLCFLGFVQRYKCLPSDDLTLTLGLLLNHRLFESYLDYLKQVRQASDGTIGEALTSAVSACRWLYRKESAERGALMPQIIRRYMDYRNMYQAMAIRTRLQNDVDELQDQNKWLDWSEFTALINKLRRDWNDDVEFKRAAEQNPTVADASFLHDLLLLGLYSCVPGRGAEVRLLQYIPEEEIVGQWKNHQQQHRQPQPKSMTMKKWVDKQKINLITRVSGRSDDGDASGEQNDVWKMYVSQYKNYRSRGVDVTELTESNFGWWTALFQSYLETYRPLLVRSSSSSSSSSTSSKTKKKKDDDHRFVFVTRHGMPFTANYFSEFLSKLLFRHTGQRVATNILRSSFVTHFYGSEEAQDPVMRESVATVMRHSVDQALRVYDRRSSASKKHKGLQLLASRQQQQHQQEQLRRSNEPSFSSSVDRSEKATVVLFQRVPHQVIREVVEANGDHMLLLGKMTRSLSTNEPVYFLPADAVFHLQARDHCIVLDGVWHEERGRGAEFSLMPSIN